MTDPVPAWRESRIATPVGELSVRESGAGHPIVLWHSLYLDGRSFDRLLPLLPTGRRLVVVDGPDHGRSTGPSAGQSYGLEECADAAFALFDALGIDRADWIGSAWGGHVGVVVAARQSGRLCSLVAIGSPMQALEQRLKPALLVALFGWFGGRGRLGRLLLDVLLDPRTRAQDPSLASYVLEAVNGPPRSAMKRAMKSVMLGRPELVSRLSRIEVPTLFITGDSELWPLALAREQAALISDARVEHVPGTRHLPALEKPSEVASLIASFWTEAGRMQS